MTAQLWQSWECFFLLIEHDICLLARLVKSSGDTPSREELAEAGKFSNNLIRKNDNTCVRAWSGINHWPVRPYSALFRVVLGEDSSYGLWDLGVVLCDFCTFSWRRPMDCRNSKGITGGGAGAPF